MRLLLQSGKTISFHGPADITKETSDAIVNAANSSLLGGGGVDGAIHRCGGPSILAECKTIVTEIGRLAPGKAVITGSGRLPAKFVIHTVGPIYRDGKAASQKSWPARIANPSAWPTITPSSRFPSQPSQLEPMDTPSPKPPKSPFPRLSRLWPRPRTSAKSALFSSTRPLSAPTPRRLVTCTIPVFHAQLRIDEAAPVALCVLCGKRA